MKKIFFLIFSLPFLGLYGQTTKPSKPIVDSSLQWQNYLDTSNKFSFRYPANWTIRIPNEKESAKIFIRSPKENDDDSFIENINLIIREVRVDKINVEMLKKSVKEALEKKVNQYEFISGKNTTWLGTSAYEIYYSSINSGEKVKILQRVAFLNNKLYTITYVASYDNTIYYKKAIEIMNTFRLQ